MIYNHYTSAPATIDERKTFEKVEKILTEQNTKYIIIGLIKQERMSDILNFKIKDQELLALLKEYKLTKKQLLTWYHIEKI